MKVLLLGGDGFIGSHLLQKHILKGDRCTVLDINNIRTSSKSTDYKFIKHDISKTKLEKILKEERPDLVYNCIAVATPSYYVKYPLETFELDFELNYYNICKPLLKSQIPFVHFSTSEVYGKKWLSIQEENKTNLIIGPTNKLRWIYATSKILLEQLLIGSRQNNFIIIRPQNFCGWDMDWLPGLKINKDKKWIPRLPACFLNALFFNKPIYVVRPGSQKRCYTHINDAVEGIYSLITNWSKCNQDPIFNIGNPNNEIDILSLANLYKDIWYKQTGKKSQKIKLISGEKYYGKGYEDCDRRLFSDKKIKQTTGWSAKINLDETISSLISDALKNYKIDF
jgi:nucleoside-diphosphate-sugar epimerase